MKEIIDFALSAPNHSELATYGQLGDYIGGTLGTIATIIISLLTVILIYKTYKSSLKAAEQQRIYSVVEYMLTTHDNIVESLSFNELQGRDVFRALLKDLHAAHVQTKKQLPNEPLRKTLDIAYTIFYYGPTITASRALEKIYSKIEIKNANDGVSKHRDSLYKKLKNQQDKRLSGQQLRLGHYFRNLFALYRLIDESTLHPRDKINIAKTIRAKLSNHEQALLAINCISNLGQEWEARELLGKYEIIKNIPEHFLSFDRNTEIKDLFPYIRFEWEASGSFTIKRWSKKFGPIQIYFHRHIKINS